MKYFFFASIHGLQQYEQQYRIIEREVRRVGHDIDMSTVLGYTPESMAEMSDDQDMSFHKSVTNGMRRADAFIFEVSYPSMSVGYNLANAVQLGKPVIIFYSGKEEPHILRTMEQINDKLQVIRYASNDELINEIPTALIFASDTQDTRFNFFISSSQSTYLDWVSKHKKISRSVYLRNLIREDMDARVG